MEIAGAQSAVQIPKYLSIHWVWLLVALAIEELVQYRLPWDWLSYLKPLLVWSFVQAGWLARVDRRSRALLWYVASLLVGQLSWFFFGSHPATLPSPHSPLFLPIVIWLVVDLGVGIAGTFVFRFEMQRFFRERDVPDMQLGLGMTFFFNTLYFQRYFHDIASGQRASSLTTAEAG